jgi:hypothetical protein
VIRNYGVNGLQRHIREGVRLAKKFEALVLADPRFEIPATRHLGKFFVVFVIIFANQSNSISSLINDKFEIHYFFLCKIKGMVVFRLKGENELTEKVRLSNLFFIVTIHNFFLSHTNPIHSTTTNNNSKQQKKLIITQSF